MYLRKLIIVNYKSCQKVSLEFDKDLPNVLIGINDSGKSTILKAIGLLLDDSISFSFANENTVKSDMSNGRVIATEIEKIFRDNGLPEIEYSLEKCIIIGRFELEIDEIDVDKEETLSNHLLWSIENADENQIWMCKVFSESDNTGTRYLLTKENKKQFDKLWTLSKTNLTKAMSTYGVTKEDVENVNNAGPFKKLEQIRAIYNNLDLVSNWSEYKDFKSDKISFPTYMYLDWNLTLKDLTKFAQEVLSTVVDKHLTELKTHSAEYSQKANLDVDKGLEEIVGIMVLEVPTIKALKANVVFDVSSNLTDLMIDKTNSDGLIHIESQGEGIKRQIWFAFVKWKALRSLDDKVAFKKFIWCFDEPETHLYPKAQREFYDLIKTVSGKNVQTFLCTHSTIFTDRSNFRMIKNVYLENKYTEYSQCSTVEDVYTSLQLRNSDFLFFEKFLVVEGDTEETLFPFLYQLFKKATMLDDNIQLIKLNGKNKRLENKLILENILKDFNKPENSIIYILDNDAKFDLKFAENEKHFLIGKQDLEDSIDNRVWVAIAKECLSLEDIVKNEDVQMIKDSISSKTKIEKNLKFYEQFQKLLRNKKADLEKTEINYSVLPSKGSELGNLLARYIDDMGLIDAKIFEAFAELNK